MISYALWQNKFAADRSILGHTITLGGEAYTVVGVAPPAYILTPPAERVWIPLAPPTSRLSDFGDHELTVYGLLKPGVPRDVAVRQLAQIDTRLAHEHPHSGLRRRRDRRTPLLDKIAGPHRTTLYTLLGAVGLVLLIACGNIANLLLARANVRRAEIAIRGALGASRGRIVSQLLVESTAARVTGGVLGLALAAAGMRFLVTSPARIPRLQRREPQRAGARVHARARACCARCIFGLVPALRASRLDLQQTLRDGGRESRRASANAFATFSSSASCVSRRCCWSARLLIRSAISCSRFRGLRHAQSRRVRHRPPAMRAIRATARVEAAFQQIESAIAAVPGVQVGRPLAGRADLRWRLELDSDSSGQRRPRRGRGHDGHAERELHDYFNDARAPLLRGREFTVADGPNAPPVAIVSRGLAKRLWGNEDPIGKRIPNGSARSRHGARSSASSTTCTRTAAIRSRRSSSTGHQRADVNWRADILVRGSVPVMTLMPAIRRAVAAVDPLLALTNVSTIDEALAASSRCRVSRCCC